MNMRRPLSGGRQLSSLEPIWPPGSSHYGGGARIEPLWWGSPHQGQTPHETVRRVRKFHFLTHMHTHAHAHTHTHTHTHMQTHTHTHAHTLMHTHTHTCTHTNTHT